jgi:spondin N
MLRTPSTHVFVTISLALSIAACGKEAPKPAGPARAAPAARQPMPTGPAEYRIVVKSTWTPRSHPFEYPSGAHFSGLIGASHNANYSIFSVGSRPTPGLERLSEEGKHSPLNDEIRAAIEAGNALAMFETGSLKNFRDSLVATVQVDAKHPMVSVVNMIAPSPDWFTGASSVNLVENGAWVKTRTLTLPAYDSGGDDGRTYNAADRNTNPKKPTSRAATRHFVVNGKVKPVATIRFTKVSP